MIDRIIRTVMTSVGAVLGYWIAKLSTSFGFLSNIENNNLKTYIYFGVSILFGIIFFIISPKLIKVFKKGLKALEVRLQEMPAFDIILSSIGLIVGLVIAYLLSRLLIEIPFVGFVLSGIMYLLLGYLGILIPNKKKDDFFGLLDIFKRSSHKDKSSKSQSRVHPKVLDTSVIIDGRIADICKTGFVEGPLVIPEFVLEELQHIADSSDSLKRNRGRRGLDILNKIQKELDIEVIIHEKDFEDISEVDSKLLKLAQFMKGKVVTNDYNLNKVAEFHGVDVLNINELANAVKPVVLPGEQMAVTVIKDGKESGQGVAYLDDGTMIVVEGGKKHIGEHISVLVTSVLQTAAGRMIFAKPKSIVDKAV